MHVRRMSQLHKKTIFLFSILIYSSICLLLEVRLTKYQMIHPDKTPAAQQYLHFCLHVNGGPLVSLNSEINQLRF